MDDIHGAARAHHRHLARGPGKVHVAMKVLAAHHYVRAAVRLPGQNAYLRNGRLRVGEYQLSPVPDDAAVLLLCAWHESWNVYECNQRYVESVAEPNEPRRLHRCVNIQNPGYPVRLVRHYSDRPPTEPREPDDNIRGEVLVNLHEVPVVNDAVDYVEHIVGLVGVVRYHVGKFVVLPVGVVPAASRWRVLHVVGRKESQQPPDLPYAVLLRIEREVRHAAPSRVRRRPAQFLVRHVLAGHRTDYVRPGYVHLPDARRHEDEVRQRGGVGRATGRRPKYHRDLRHHARSPHVPVEYVAVSREAVHPFLDARAAGVYQPDHRCPVRHRQVHHFAYLLSHRLRQRPAQHREVLRIDIDEPPADLPVACNHRVAEVSLAFESEVRRAMHHEGVQFLEGAFVQQQLDSLAGRQLAAAVLRLDAPLPAAERGLLSHSGKLGAFVGFSSEYHVSERGRVYYDVGTSLQRFIIIGKQGGST